MEVEEVRTTLKGLKLNSKDAVTDYVDDLGLYRMFDVYLRAIVKRRDGSSPRW